MRPPASLFSARLLSAVLLAAVPLSVPLAVQAAGSREQRNPVREPTRNGDVLSLKEIERKVLPSMAGMEYLGPEYDPAARVYRLKFIHAGRVVFVDVDARTGQVLQRSR
jgi:uncharacterized membrane protein YkoI